MKRAISGKHGARVWGVLALLVLLALVGGLAWNLGFRPRQRSMAYDSIIWEASRRHRISPLLVKAVIRRESKFSPWARGRAGEVGLMQITDHVVQDWERWSGERCAAKGMLFDPRLNIEIGTWYLALALKRWRGYRDVEMLALAQYNAGPANAGRWAPKDPRERVLNRIRFPMTREYILKVLEYRLMYERKYRGKKE
jgi:soluble lytic murein transglycosylase